MSDATAPTTSTAFLMGVGRDFRDLASNRMALFGGLFGTIVVWGLLVAAMLVLRSAAASEGDDEDDELVMDFTPGALVRLGQKLEEKDMPEKIIVQETQAESGSAAEKVTKDEQAAAAEQPSEKPDEKAEDPNAKPNPNKKKDVPTSKTPTDSNTPFKDLPTVTQPLGDPFGSPDGWADMAKDGDPWATAVVGVLSKGLKANTYGAQALGQQVKFRITICKDGKLEEVQIKQSSGNPQVDYSIQQNLRNLRLPPPPPAVAQQLASRCKRIPYQFTWNPSKKLVE